MSVAGKAIRGARWTTLQQLSGNLIDFVVFLVLARLLVPRDFGLVALALTVIQLGRPLIEQGVGVALIQRSEIESAHKDSAFWGNIGAAALLAVVLVFGGSWIAELFDEPDLKPILAWFSLGFLLLALSGVQTALIQRDMDFRALAIRTLVGQVAGGLVGITMAVSGFGVWSLVGKQLVQNGVSTLLLWRVSSWRPGLRFSPRHFRELLRFGIHVTGMHFLSFLTNRSVNLFVGYFLGSTALGFFAIAMRLYRLIFQVVTSTITSVGVPAFSRIQDDIPLVRASFFKLSQLAAAVSLPLCVGASLLSRDIIEVVFGEGWSTSADVFRVLVLAGIGRCLLRPMGAVVVAMGRADWRLALQTLEASLTAVFIVVAVAKGLVAVAAAILVVELVQFPIWLGRVRALTGISLREYLAKLAGTAGATALMAGAVFLVSNVISVSGPYQTPVQVAISVLAGAVVYGAGSLVLAPDSTALMKSVIGKLILPAAGRRGPT